MLYIPCPIYFIIKANLLTKSDNLLISLAIDLKIYLSSVLIKATLSLKTNDAKANMTPIVATIKAIEPNQIIDTTLISSFTSAGSSCP